MKLLTFEKNGSKKIGVLKKEIVIDINASYEALLFKEGNIRYKESAEALVPRDMIALLETGKAGLDAAELTIEKVVSKVVEIHPDNKPLTYKLEDVNILAPITRPEKILCIGLNYIDHCKETGMDIPESPITFSKFANTIIGPNEAIELPVNSEQVDFEAELAVVIGKTGKRITEEKAMDYVAGYMNLNDVSARDLQFMDGQWTRGKAPDTFAPSGPYIVTEDEILDPDNLNISLDINGERYQDSNTSNLIFKIPQLISFLSQSMTLKPGDIIATGTPPGVGMSRTPQVWLKEGDVVVVRIEGLGELTNNVIKAI